MESRVNLGEKEGHTNIRHSAEPRGSNPGPWGSKTEIVQPRRRHTPCNNRTNNYAKRQQTWKEFHFWKTFTKLLKAKDLQEKGNNDKGPQNEASN